MVIWIGIDDTDSRLGGCTTYLVPALVEKIYASSELAVIGYPRLVRLNPDISWKTRGNGAICLRVGYGHGDTRIIGEWNNNKYYAYVHSKSKKGSYEPQVIAQLETIVRDVIEAHAWFNDPTTNPGFVIMYRKPPYSLYLRAVRSIVDINYVEHLLASTRATYSGYKHPPRGLIGATAAISWVPRDRTYEIMTYREPTRWGTKRKISVESVIAMDQKFRSTFNNYDYNNKHVCITPNSPCPVYFGIRGDNVDVLLPAMTMIEGEPIDCWIIFETNQATDAHLTPKPLASVKPYEPSIVSGVVCSPPQTIRGGHVIFTLTSSATSFMSTTDKTYKIYCAAYEPTKEFRAVIRELVIGDHVTVFGGVRTLDTCTDVKITNSDFPTTINIEKIKINRLVAVWEKVRNPVCKICGKSMKSIGKDQGYRCKTCGTRADKSAAEYRQKPRKINIGYYEVPPSARRHLSKPLSRMTRT
jgi:tRNA(Ile2)-agmatinylcytidine synthase